MIEATTGNPYDISKAEETSTTGISYNLPERSGRMLDIKNVVKVLIHLLEEQENVKIEYEFKNEAYKEVKAG